MAEWVIFDYGVGNLHSLRQALVRAGAQASVTQNLATLLDADVAVLPGVGAFGHVMESLAPALEGLQQRHRDGRPILGVCIGQQVLYERSEETPDVPGLGILSGTVKRLPPDAGKVPHMGWNTTLACAEDPVILQAGGAHVYYVHSYAAPPGDSTIATSQYGMVFSAAEHKDNTVAFQFHPEKSGAVGARILEAAVQTLEGAL